VRKQTKFRLLRVSIILAFAILAMRVWYVQVVMGSYYKQQGDTSKIRLEPVQALRGIIYDRYGHQLVWNFPSWNVVIVPHGIPDSQANRIYAELSNLLGHNPTAAQIARTVYDNRWRAYAPVLIKGEVSPDTAMVIKQLHSQLPGVQANPSSIRHYIQDPQLSESHVIGYARDISPDQYTADRHSYPAEHVGALDQAGQAGIELSMDPYLHGVNSTAEVEVDAGERPVRVLRNALTVPGDSVYLTLDQNLQSQVAGDLSAALNKLGVSRGVAIVENVNTGEILAMVSLPSFDNNWFSGRGNSARINAVLKDPAQPLFDLATAGQYPPGSTYKIITATAALQTHTVDVNTTIMDTGSIRLCSVYDPSSCKVYYGWQASGLGPMNVVSALAHSSDIYMYTVAGGDPNTYPCPPNPCIGATRLASYAREFGLGTPTGIELPNERPGFVPTPAWFDNLKPIPNLKNPGDSWHIGDTYNMAIGQGFNLATPLQMVNVAATIANRGTLYRPRIVERIEGRVVPRRGVLARSQILQPFVPQIVRRNFIDPYNLSLIQEGLHDSVSLPTWQGTSYLVQDPRIDAAGKTGTAEILPHPPHAWWIGYAPFNHPKIAVAVMVPYAGGEGAYAAAPIAHKIFEDYFHLKPILPDKPGDSNWLDDVSATLVGSGGAQ